MTKYTHDELVKRAKSPGWKLSAGADETRGTLEDVARAAHARRKGGKETGAIKEIETAIELEMLELEKLWLHLGLPM